MNKTKATIKIPISILVVFILNVSTYLKTISTYPHTTINHTYSEFKQKIIIWNADKLESYQMVAGTLLSKCESSFPDLECIPLKCSLISELLVKSAELCLDSKPPPKKKKETFSNKINQAWEHLNKRFNIWKQEGKEKDTSLTYQMYKSARSHFQYTRRMESNLAFIKSINLVMQSHSEDRNMVYKLMKNSRRESKQSITNKLITPTGTYLGSDVLEGFATDAETLGNLPV